MLIDQITQHFCCTFTLDISSDGLFQKKSKHGPKVENMEFPLQGYWRKGTWKSQGPIKKKWNLWGFYKEKLMWNFLGSWFLTLEFPRGGTQFCRISRGESLFSLEFPKVKWQILKFQRENFGKVYPPPNLFGVFLE